MERAYRIWRTFLDRVVGPVAALTFLGVTVLAIVEIFRRYVLGRTFYWGQDAVTYVLVASAFLYFGVTQANRDHLAVTALPDWLKAGRRHRALAAVRLVANLLSLAFLAGMLYWGFPSAERSRLLGRMTESMIIPLWPFMYVLLLGFLLMAISLLFQIYREVQALRGKEVFAWDRIEDSMEI